MLDIDLAAAPPLLETSFFPGPELALLSQANQPTADELEIDALALGATVVQQWTDQLGNHMVTEFNIYFRDSDFNDHWDYADFYDGTITWIYDTETDSFIREDEWRAKQDEEHPKVKDVEGQNREPVNSETYSL